MALTQSRPISCTGPHCPPAATTRSIMRMAYYSAVPMPLVAAAAAWTSGNLRPPSTAGRSCRCQSRACPLSLRMGILVLLIIQRGTIPSGQSSVSRLLSVAGEEQWGRRTTTSDETIWGRTRRGGGRHGNVYLNLQHYHHHLHRPSSSSALAIWKSSPPCIINECGLYDQTYVASAGKGSRPGSASRSGPQCRPRSEEY